ncbi:hypothetical protein FPS98_29250 [Brevibacillus brevis]|uniref:Uncharacterized protein n=1 Tax=Brevibacillus brevis TaxID=1393 RepID=A0A517IFS9_BREBE|nr:hypothetical protein FPS98_29250 [Brevibacillus brevis]
MFSSRLYPHFVRAVSFQTCDRAFEHLQLHSIFLKHLLGDFSEAAWEEANFQSKRLWSPT